MDQKATLGICPRCNGKGRIEAFSHIHGGVCFDCCGCGLDLRSEVRRVEVALTEARSEWRRMYIAAGQARPGTLRAEAFKDALSRIEREGVALREQLETTVARINELRDRNELRG